MSWGWFLAWAFGVVTGWVASRFLFGAPAVYSDEEWVINQPVGGTLEVGSARATVVDSSNGKAVQFEPTTLAHPVANINDLERLCQWCVEEPS